MKVEAEVEAEVEVVAEVEVEEAEEAEEAAGALKWPSRARKMWHKTSQKQ